MDNAKVLQRLDAMDARQIARSDFSAATKLLRALIAERALTRGWAASVDPDSVRAADDALAEFAKGDA